MLIIFAEMFIYIFLPPKEWFLELCPSVIWALLYNQMRKLILIILGWCVYFAHFSENLFNFSVTPNLGIAAIRKKEMFFLKIGSND